MEVICQTKAEIVRDPPLPFVSPILQGTNPANYCNYSHYD